MRLGGRLLAALLLCGVASTTGRAQFVTTYGLASYGVNPFFGPVTYGLGTNVIPASAITVSPLSAFNVTAFGATGGGGVTYQGCRRLRRCGGVGLPSNIVWNTAPPHDAVTRAEFTALVTRVSDINQRLTKLEPEKIPPPKVKEDGPKKPPVKEAPFDVTAGPSGSLADLVAATATLSNNIGATRSLLQGADRDLAAAQQNLKDAQDNLNAALRKIDKIGGK
jgi:hypothetical protein